MYTSRDEAELLRRLVRPTPREKYTHFLFEILNFSRTLTLSNLIDATPKYRKYTYLVYLFEKSRFSGLWRVKKKCRHRTSLVRKHSRQTATHGYGPPPRSGVLDCIRQTTVRTVSIASVTLRFLLKTGSCSRFFSSDIFRIWRELIYSTCTGLFGNRY